MRFDIVIVLYNSAQWLPVCISALKGVSYDLKQLHLVLVDNHSGDDTGGFLDVLAAEEDNGGFGGLTILRNQSNVGFGTGCNQGAKAGNAPFLFFLNVDTAVEPDLFEALDKGIESRPDAGAYECRQLPYEMGHHVDPVTLETDWASGAAVIVRRTVFEEVGGFDRYIFMYCEDVDLSWRVRAAGKRIVYVPGAVVNHFVLGRQNTAQSELREYYGTEMGRLLLAYKYGTVKQVWRANLAYLRELRAPRHFENVRKVFAKGYLGHFARLWPFWFWRFQNRALFKGSHGIAVLDQKEFSPERGREVLEKRVANGPQISVVVRTCSRPQVLRGALQSLANQTYPNYEVVVVEDGLPVSQGMVEAEFAHLPLRYVANGKNLGRGKAGNRGLALATGDYLSFLDDDDYLYPDHLELMAQKAMQYPEADLILGCAMVMKIQLKSKDPYQYSMKELYPMRFDRLDIFTMCQTCQIPIQSAVFKRALYEECGGLREDIEGNEDWAMWMRFLAKGKRIDPKHIDIHRATSIFLLPAGDAGEKARNDKYKVYNQAFFEDETIKFEVTLADMRGYFDDMIGDFRHLEQIGETRAYLERQAARDADASRDGK